MLIDQLAFNVLALHGDPSTSLHRYYSGLLPLPDGLNFFETDSTIHCSGYDRRDEACLWDCNTFTVWDRHFPEAVLQSFIGRPITKMIVHPVLSDNMIITKARNATGNNYPYVEIEFDQPILLCCSRSGRAWLSEEILDDYEVIH